MISIRDALDLVLGAVVPRPAEEVALPDALGRVLADDVRAAFALPPFANSQMDGFAVRARDLAGASASRAAELRVTGTIAAGTSELPPVEAGCAVRIMTGGAIPPGADAVVKVEDTESAGGVVRIAVAPRPGEFVRPAGEDVRAGDRVLERGRLLRAADVGMLAALGRPTVRVASRPRVAVLATGDELVPLGEPLTPGRIYNSNAYALAAACREAGADAAVLGAARDERSELTAALRAAASFDVALTTGGVSVGDFDYVKDVMDEIGLERRFWQVAQKPGKPITFAARDGRLFFGLPGNPVSSLVCFELYVAPALRRALGMRDVFPATVDVTLRATVKTARDLTELVRCRLDRQGDTLYATPTGTQSSGALSSVALADALVVSPPGIPELREGTRAKGLLTRTDRPLGSTHPFG